MRKVFFWLHLAAGVSAGIVILMMSVTGALLMYEKQLTAWADGYRVTPQTARLSVEALLSKARAERPKASPSALTVSADPTAPVSVSFGREGLLFFDPYTGAALGEGSKSARAFFRSMTDWHRWLATEGESRATGRAVTGAANLLFLFIVMSGFYLWWPRNWSWIALKSVVLFRSGLSGKARDFNWHNVIGLWSAAPLFFVVLSGVVMSYPWANDLLYRLTGNEPPARPAGPAAPAGRQAAGGPSSARAQRGPSDAGPRQRPGGARESRSEALDFTGLNALWATAERQIPEWRTITLRFPNGPSAPLTFAIDASSGAARPDKRSQLTLDRTTGAVVRFEPYSSQNLGRQLRSWARFVHTGEAFGLPGQTVAGIVSAGGAVLVWTGLALAWRRLLAWFARRSAATASNATALSIDGQA